MKDLRKVKIVCTIGPASEDYETLKSLVKSGMNVMRLNFSHGSHEEHAEKMNTMRKINAELNSHVAIMLDTKGPEIRTHTFEYGGVTLLKGSIVRVAMHEVVGTAERFSVTHANLINDVKVGGKILVDDGNVTLTIKELDFKNEDIVCYVENDAYIKDRRGINVPDVNLSMDFISPRDRSDIEFGCEQKVDFIAASFVRRPSDVLEIRAILEEKGCPDIKIISKIENIEGVKNLDEIIKVSDGLMVARGDLGVEVPVYEVPVIQKEMINKCLMANRPVIVATQMLESMQKNPRPTRAEVNDVATAVLSGADAIMLSGETASGKYPVESVRMMDQIARRMEREMNYEQFLNTIRDNRRHDITSSIALSVVDAANQLNISCIITPTSSGVTAMRLSNFRPPVPIIAVTMDERVMRSLALSWGVHPCKIELKKTTDEVIDDSVRIASENYNLQKGEMAIITCNMPLSSSITHANMMKIHQVE